MNGVEQTAGAHFMLSPAPKPWDDFHVISWAHYPDGFYDLLGQVGVDATIAYKEATDPVLDNNFNFYVEQLMWEVFAIYYSQASMQVHWLLDNVGNAREWPLHSGGDHASHFIAVRNGWTKTIEDLGLQYEFVGRGHIE